MAFPQTAAPTVTQIGTPSASHAINMPGTVNVGDLLRAVIGLNESETLTEDGGTWTQLYEIDGAGQTGLLACFVRKVADQTEADALAGGTVSFTSNDSTTGAAQVYRIPAASWFGDLAGVEAGTPLHESGTSTPNPPSLTTTWAAQDNLWFVDLVCVDDDIAADTAPANYGNLVSTVSGAGTNAGASVNTARRELAATTDDPGTWSLPESERSFSNTVVIRPAPAGATRLYGGIPLVGGMGFG